MSQHPSRSTQRFLLYAFALYAVGAILVTYPLVMVIATRYAGHPLGDAYEYAHHSAWIAEALTSGRDPLYIPHFVHPDGVPAPLLWSMPLQSFPAWALALILPTAAAFNLSLLLALTLNGWAMALLVRRVTGRGDAALIAGLVYQLYPAFQGHIGAAHIGLLMAWGAPLLVLALLGLRGARFPRRWMLAAALLVPVSLGGSPLLLIYLVAPVVIGALVMLRDDRVALRRALVALILGGVLWLPVVAPLALEQIATAGDPRFQNTVRYSAPIAAIAAPSFYHPLFDEWDFNRRAIGAEPFEQASYYGVIALCLSLIAGIADRRARVWLLVAVGAWVLSWGSALRLLDADPVTLRIGQVETLIPLPGALLEVVPGLNIARTPARFNFAVGFAAAILSGYGAAWALARLRSGRLRWALVAVAGGVIALEYQFWWGLPTMPAQPPAAIAALSERDDLRAALSLPSGNPLVTKREMFLYLGHRVPLIAGQVARTTTADPAKLRLLTGLDPALLAAAEVDLLIVHRGHEPALEGAARARFGDPDYADDEYLVYLLPPYAGDPPVFRADPRNAGRLTTTADAPFYAPASGWVSVTLAATAEAPRAILLIDGESRVWGRWQVAPGSPVEAVVRLPTSGGFAMLTAALDPPCAAYAPATTVCPAVDLTRLTVDYTADTGLSDPDRLPVRFAHGVMLSTWRIAVEDAAIAVDLAWAIDSAIDESMIRYLHILDEAGVLVAQDDAPLGAVPAGDARGERLTFPDLPPGTYQVRAGWYAFPQVAPYCILGADGRCTTDSAAALATVIIPPPASDR